MSMRGPGLLLLLAHVVAVQSCGPPPPCCGPPPSLDCCRVPDINVTVTDKGLEVQCPESVCGFVNEELDPAPCGCTWENEYTLSWSDSRIGPCLYTNVEDGDKLVRGTVRWWTLGCMGHVDVVVRIVLQPDERDVFIDYPSFEYNKQVGVASGFAALARGGSDDDIPQADKSNMFFEVIMEEPVTGVHMEVTGCDLDILDSGAPDAFLLTTYTNITYNTSYADPNGEVIEYTAFMDDRYYSPYQRIRCTYALFNGTTTLDTFTHAQSYMIVNPFDEGVIVSR